MDLGLGPDEGGRLFDERGFLRGNDGFPPVIHPDECANYFAKAGSQVTEITRTSVQAVFMEDQKYKTLFIL
jgi:hypothetical protein